MYYLWHDDHTGRLLRQEVIEAANRGVRVRMLLDDFNPRANDCDLSGTGQPPQHLAAAVQPEQGERQPPVALVRAGVPTRRHDPPHAQQGLDRRRHLCHHRRPQHRRCVFRRAETNFRDLDVLLLGKGVEQTARIFESYWNCSAVKPIQSLHPVKPDRKAARASLAAEAEASSPQLDRVRDLASMADFIAAARQHALDGAGDRHLRPAGKGDRATAQELADEDLAAARPVEPETLEIISPYFVPGRKGASILRSMAGRRRQGGDPDQFAGGDRCRGGSRRLCQISSPAAARRRAAVRAAAVRAPAEHLRIRFEGRQPSYQGFHRRRSGRLHRVVQFRPALGLAQYRDGDRLRARAAGRRTAPSLPARNLAADQLSAGAGRRRAALGSGRRRQDRSIQARTGSQPVAADS